MENLLKMGYYVCNMNSVQKKFVQVQVKIMLGNQGTVYYYKLVLY